MKIEIKNRFNREVIISGEYLSVKDAILKNSGADLSYADLRGADLGGADLNYADLGDADLGGADLGGADLDFSCTSFSCKDFNQKLDAKHFYQRLYHLLKQDYQELPADVKKFINSKKIIELANRFHRVAECGELEQLGKG